MRMALFKLTNGAKKLRYVDCRMTPERFLKEYTNEDWCWAVVKLRGKVRRIRNDRLQQLVFDYLE